ncbi:hypothetical protein AL049_12615 [Pseudomonas syringae pv. cerasicola]|nr:hypothetical protein [Pseudomonas syringae]RMS80075.1 hypothetical protein ALP61_03360 [Pseudomonas savastanoi]KWS97998.1 hypothetical protein AL049_12615 [Pseudomonas syringae pv. cerasicola]PHN69740.1 hypothetical protein AO252_16960 [Pseudomonas syringae pv. cerasicola]PHN71408.1 hypothetical protein AO272_20245 [Pseudomonas syringae pv. cerasicola]RMT48704.1 hypothetical protein ALP47_01386 [Pseudomonas savastanoi]
MPAGAAFIEDLQKQAKGLSESCHTVFAIPQMRDYRYRVMLDREARIVPQYAGDDDKGLWLQLRDGQLVSQQQFGSADALRAALKKPQP